MEPNSRKSLLIKTLTLMLLASALTCLIILFTAGRELGVFNGSYEELREYAALLAKIEEYYIGEYNDEEIYAAAKRAAVEALGDRWSFYLTPDEYAAFMDNSNNRFIGIGVAALIDEATGGMRVESVYRSSAAEDGGLIAGDVIIGIDGEDITHTEFDYMRSLLVRPVGDGVILTILHSDGSIDNKYVLYDVVFTDPIEYEMLDGHIGYIAISNFDSGAANSFIAAAEELVSNGADAFLFDVRGNNGGRVSELTRILDHLLSDCEIFVAVDRYGNEEVAMAGPGAVDLPCVVLVDRNSFSAAEYFAATLGEYGYAITVGEQTTGKNRSQVTVDLPGGGALHISSGQYLTKNRVSLYDSGGLTPDYSVAMSDEESLLLITGNLEKEADPQIEMAIGLLNE